MIPGEARVIFWPHQENINMQFSHVNCIRPSMQFTIDKEMNSELAFCTENGFRALSTINDIHWMLSIL